MTPEQAFLEDIRANPADDTPRLIFADWLTDRNQSGDADRADFIRLQCRLAGMTEDDLDYEDLLDRQGELLGRHRAEWLAGVPASFHQGRLVFRRGFVDEVETRLGFFLQAGRQLLDRTPLTRVVLSPPLADNLQPLARFPGLQRVSSLCLKGCGLDTDALALLLASEHLGRLTDLDLSGNRMDDRGARDPGSAETIRCTRGA